MSTFARTHLALGLSLAAILAIATPAAAQQVLTDDRKFTAASFYAENDLFQLGRIDEDRNYTGGFAFQFKGTFVREAHLDAPLLALDRLSRVDAKHEEWKSQRFYTLLVFGTAFTPDNLNTARPILDDRPYGSLLGVSVRRLSVKPESNDQTWSSELAIAWLGSPVARNLQTWIHRRLRARSGLKVPYDPLGWHNQISDGGEPTALYRVTYERNLAGDTSLTGRKHFQLSGGLAGSAGYYTNVSGLVNARAGWFTSNFWEFTPAAITNVGAQRVARTPTPNQSRWELFAFAGARPQLVLYNALLQGQFRESVHTVPIKHNVLEWDLGVAAFIPQIRMQLSWNVLAGRTSEFEGGTPRTHTWGSLIATYAMPLPRRR